MGRRHGAFPQVKQAFGIALAASLLLAGVLLWLSQDTVDGDGRPLRPRSGGGDFFDPRSAAGRDIFVPEMDSALIEGELASWPAALFWCGAVEPGEDARVSIERLRVLVNLRPQVRADLDRLVRAPADSAPAALGAEIERLVRSEHAGMLADAAVLRGGYSLQTVRQMELHGNAMVARRHLGVPGRELISGADLVLDFDKGQLQQARSVAAVSMEGPLFALSAEGLNLDARSGALELTRKVSGKASRPLLNPQATTPFVFTSAGALRFTPDAAPTESAWFLSGGLLECSGGIEAQEAATALRAQQMELRFVGEPFSLSTLKLQGRVDAQLPLFAATGDSLDIDQRSGAIRASGTPLALRWNEAGGALRTLEIDGPMEYGTTAQSTLRAPGQVHLSGPDLDVRGREVVVVLGDPLATRSAEPGANKRARPETVLLLAPTGRFGPCEFSAQSAALHAAEESAAAVAENHFDRLELEREPRLVLRLPQGSRAAAPWLGSAADTPLVLVIEAADKIVVATDPRRIQPTLISATDQVRLRVHAGDERGPVLARLLAGQVSLTVLDQFTPDLAAPSRFRRSTEVQRIELTGSVVLERGLLEVQAQYVLLQLLERTARVSGAPALVRMKAVDGTMQHCAAPEFRAELLGRALRCAGPWTGSLLLPLLTREASTRRVLTTVSSGAAQLRFQAADTFALESMEAQGPVRLQQENGGSASCDALQLHADPVRLAAQGAVLLALSRAAGDAETIAAPSLEWFADGLRVTGPLQAQLAFPAVQLMPRPAALGAASPTATLMQLHAGALSFQEGVLLLQGPVSAAQGDASAGGMSLSATQAALFFADAGAGAELVRAVLDGAVRYDSSELQARGELLRLDHKDRRLLLSGGAEGCSLTLPRSGLREHVRPSFVVDFSDPQNPVVESVDRTLPAEVR